MFLLEIKIQNQKVEITVKKLESFYQIFCILIFRRNIRDMSATILRFRDDLRSQPIRNGETVIMEYT